jgi:hypothetical protein
MKGLGSLENGIWNLDLSTVFNFLKILLATTASYPGDASISSIVRDLHMKEFVNPSEERHSQCCQSVFIMLGWLTMLYTKATTTTGYAGDLSTINAY